MASYRDDEAAGLCLPGSVVSEPDGAGAAAVEKFDGTWQNRKFTATSGDTADEKLLRLFTETDTNGGGTLDMKEIKALCRKLGCVATVCLSLSRPCVC